MVNDFNKLKKLCLVCHDSGEVGDIKKINPLEVLLSLGLQVIKDTDGKLRAFGFSEMAPADAQKAARFISENKAATALADRGIRPLKKRAGSGYDSARFVL